MFKNAFFNTVRTVLIHNSYQGMSFFIIWNEVFWAMLA